MAPMILRCTLLLLAFFSPACVFATDKPIDQVTPSQSHAKNFRVIATIRPVHSLLSSIMRGTGQAVLLLDRHQSPHHFSLRPSQRRSLSQADIIFWLGDAMETFMPRVLNAIPEKVQTVELLNNKKLHLLAPRSGSHSHSHSHGHEDNKHGHSDSIDAHETPIDPHIWLSIDNALLIAEQMMRVLSDFSPQQKAIFQANFIQLEQQLLQLKTEISLVFKQPFNYIVYHDAFQYFEEQVGLEPLTAISTDEDQSPGIRHLSQVNKIIDTNKINCLIYNTKSLPVAARNLIKNKTITNIQLDPLGQSLQSGPDLYLNLLRNMSNAYQQCQNSTAH